MKNESDTHNMRGNINEKMITKFGEKTMEQLNKKTKIRNMQQHNPKH